MSVSLRAPMHLLARGNSGQVCSLRYDPVIGSNDHDCVSRSGHRSVNCFTAQPLNSIGAPAGAGRRRLVREAPDPRNAPFPRPGGPNMSNGKGGCLSADFVPADRTIRPWYVSKIGCPSGHLAVLPELLPQSAIRAQGPRCSLVWGRFVLLETMKVVSQTLPAHASASSSAFVSFRSAVSNPSVNQS
jgi:hypothetical protein